MRVQCVSLKERRESNWSGGEGGGGRNEEALAKKK